MEPQVLHADDELVVLVKPVGMPAQPDPSGVPSVLDWVAEHYPGREPHPVQRLDRPAGGIVAVALGAVAARRLFHQFQERTVEKLYLALVDNPAALPAPEGRLEHLLVHRQRGNVSKVSDHGKPAVLEYRLLKVGRTRALVEVRLITGRHHQIRAQFAHVGCHLGGDVKYGAHRPLREGGIALFASHLALDHPRTRERLTFTARPTGRAWEPFLEA